MKTTNSCFCKSHSKLVSTCHRKHTGDVADKGPSDALFHAYRALVTSCIAVRSMCCVRMLKISSEHAPYKAQACIERCEADDLLQRDSSYSIDSEGTASPFDTGHPVVDRRLDLTRMSLQGKAHTESEETLLLFAELPLCLFSPFDIVSTCRLEAQSWRLALPSRYRWSEVWR